MRRPGRGTTQNAYNAVAGICGPILLKREDYIEQLKTTARRLSTNRVAQ